MDVWGLGTLASNFLGPRNGVPPRRLTLTTVASLFKDNIFVADGYNRRVVLIYQQLERWVPHMNCLSVCLSVHDSIELQVFSWWTARSVVSCWYLKAFAFEAHVHEYEHDAHETQGCCWCTLCAVRYLTSYRPNYKLTVNSHNENILKISQHSGA